MRINLTVTEDTARKLRILAKSPRRMGVMVDLLVADAYEKGGEVQALRKRVDKIETVVTGILVKNG